MEVITEALVTQARGERGVVHIEEERKFTEAVARTMTRDCMLAALVSGETDLHTNYYPPREFTLAALDAGEHACTAMLDTTRYDIYKYRHHKTGELMLRILQLKPPAVPGEQKQPERVALSGVTCLMLCWTVLIGLGCGAYFVMQ